MIELGPILMATDFSASSNRALEVAATLAHRFAVSVVLLHVDDGAEVAPLSEAAQTRRELARRELDRYRRSLADDDVAAQVLLRPGDPAREILRTAATHAPGMIVLGTHGCSPSTTPLLGSVADRVMRYAPFPVLVVPDPARRSALSGPAVAV